MTEKIGQRLKIARKALGLTQAELGQPMGLKWYQIKDLECGKVKNFSLILAKNLEAYFCIDSDWLLTGEGEMLCKSI